MLGDAVATALIVTGIVNITVAVALPGRYDGEDMDAAALLSASIGFLMVVSGAMLLGTTMLLGAWT